MNISYDLNKLRKVVEYVGAAQSRLDKAAQLEAAIASRAPEVVDVLVQQGLLSPHLKEAKVRALSNNPAEILDTLEKTAALVAPTSLGEGDGKSAAAKQPTSDQVFIDKLMS